MGGQVFCDFEWEVCVNKICQESIIGVQFGGKYFIYDVCVICLLCYVVFCLVGFGVFCLVDWNIKVKIIKDGIFLEQLEMNLCQLLFEMLF